MGKRLKWSSTSPLLRQLGKSVRVRASVSPLSVCLFARAAVVFLSPLRSILSVCLWVYVPLSRTNSPSGLELSTVGNGEHFAQQTSSAVWLCVDTFPPFKLRKVIARRRVRIRVNWFNGNVTLGVALSS